MPPLTLTFLHTAPTHIDTFDRLLADLAPTLPVRHIVDETLLEEARRQGLTPDLIRRVETTILEASAAGSRLVLCTCSTLGAVAERVTLPPGCRVLRIDRPMAEQAVALGQRIIVAATLASTIDPTRDLLLSVAQESGKKIELIELLCERAWAKFERGDQAGYLAEIAQALQAQTMAGDVIVLAQASMAAAAYGLDLSIPVLSSPRLGLEAALAALQSST